MIETERYKKHLEAVSNSVERIVQYISDASAKTEDEFELLELSLVYEAVIAYLFSLLLPDERKLLFDKLKENFMDDVKNKGDMVH